MFKLIDATVKPLTLEIAKAFRELEPSPTERELDPARIKHLRAKADLGQLVTFHWSTAKLGDKKLRMNGQHSSTMLCDLNGNFPEGLQVHIDEYQVDNNEGLADLFRQFDDRKSSRTISDVAGAYQGLFPELNNIPRKTAKLGIEGVAWYRRNVLGTLATNMGDDTYRLFRESGLHPFLHWLGELFDIKTPELKRASIVSAMFGTWETNPAEAKKFWHDTARGGVEYEDTAPSTVLDTWLKQQAESLANRDLKPGNYYQACIYAWNAHRDSKTITSIKHDTKKGMLPISE